MINSAFHIAFKTCLQTTAWLLLCLCWFWHCLALPSLQVPSGNWWSLGDEGEFPSLLLQHPPFSSSQTGPLYIFYFCRCFTTVSSASTVALCRLSECVSSPASIRHFVSSLMPSITFHFTFPFPPQKWKYVLDRFVVQQKTYGFYNDKQSLTPYEVMSLIMRRDNYIIALLKAEKLSVRWKLSWCGDQVCDFPHVNFSLGLFFLLLDPALCFSPLSRSWTWQSSLNSFCGICGG